MKTLAVIHEKLRGFFQKTAKGIYNPVQVEGFIAPIQQESVWKKPAICLVERSQPGLQTAQDQSLLIVRVFDDRRIGYPDSRGW